MLLHLSYVMITEGIPYFFVFIRVCFFEGQIYLQRFYSCVDIWLKQKNRIFLLLILLMYMRNRSDLLKDFVRFVYSGDILPGTA